MSTKAEKSTITREVTTTVEEEVVTLTLSMEAAKALAAVTRHIGGPPIREDGSPSVRQILTDEIGGALQRVIGVQRLVGPNTDPGRERAMFRGMYIPAAKTVTDQKETYW